MNVYFMHRIFELVYSPHFLQLLVNNIKIHVLGAPKVILRTYVHGEEFNIIILLLLHE